MYDGNSLAIGWPDIRYYGYENYDEYLYYCEEEEEEDEGQD